MTRFDPEQELRAREHRLDRRCDTSFESALTASVLVELQQRREVALRQRTAERLRRQPPDDASCARHFLARTGRAAREHLAPTVGLGNARRPVRPDDAQVLQVRERRDAKRDADLRVRECVIDRREQVDHRPFELLKKRRRHSLGARRDMDGGGLQRHARRRFRHARIDLEQRDALAVDRHFELLAGGRAAEKHAARVAVQVHAEDVVAVGRKRVHDREPAARAERRAVDAAQLRRSLGDLVVGFARGRFGIAERQHGDLAGRPQIARRATSARTICESAMLSKPSLMVSAGSRAEASTSTPSRSLTARAYSARLRR